MHNKRTAIPILFAVTAFALVFALTLCSGVGIARRKESGVSLVVADSEEEDISFGQYTFKRTMLLSDGTTAEFFESGDEYFKYSHDADGYVLLRDNDALTLEYAVNQDGRPVSSGVSFNACARDIEAVPKMTAGDIDLEANPDLLISYEGDNLEEVEIEPLFGSDMSGTIINLVIYITFKDVSFSPSSEIVNIFNGASNSLESYYRVMSNNAVTIKSVMPYDGSAVYVYKDSEKRSYYNTDGTDRKNKEATLLTNAISAAKTYFSGLSSYNLDVNGDGYLDSLSFVVAGDSSSTWGSLLWPHSWNLDTIDGAGKYSSFTGKNGQIVKVGKYSFNFASALNTGVVCHETAHVLGAPDLYHYEYDFVPVGKWDLMQFNQSTPQYMLTYMRDKYIGGISSSAIEDISANGVYSLAPVSSAASGVLAYRIPTARTGEYFMVEYRRVTASGYDSALSGSGLIVYRVKEPSDYSSSTGNQEATYKGTGKYADEVYVFRPQITVTGKESSAQRYQNSKKDVEYAYLSPNNPYFSEVGTTDVATRYSYGNLFFSDGSNSGIVIKALSISGTSLEFSVHVSSDTQIPDDYFVNKISVTQADITNTTEFAGVTANVEFGSLNISYLSALELVLTDANGGILATNTANTGKLLSEYKSGARKFECRFVYADKGNSFDGVFGIGAFSGTAVPAKLTVRATDADGDEITIATVAVTDTYNVGWDTVLASKTERSAMIAASSTATIGVTRSGNVVAVGAISGVSTLQSLTNAVSAAVGLSHALVVKDSLTVTAVGTDKYGETSVSTWNDVKAVAAGDYTSYGLRTDGTVVAAGANQYGQLAVDDWTEVTSISARGQRVVGITKEGKILYAGNFSESEATALKSIGGAIGATCGGSYVAVLFADGTVGTYGTFVGGDTSSWRDVTSVSAGEYHLLGLKSDGSVYATGDNTYNQCYVSNLCDVIYLAAGESHSAFLRKDGVVEYRGLDKSGYGINGDLGNLIYNSYVAVKSIGGVSVNGASVSTVRVPLGGTVGIDVVYSPQSVTYVRMLFTSYDSSVASVTASGTDSAVIVGNGIGQTIINIVENGSKISKSVTVEVYKESPLTGIKFADSTKSILVGHSVRLAVELLPADAVYYGVMLYESSAPDVVAVDSDGVITASSAAADGATATITVTLGEFSATCLVTVASGISGAEVVIGENAKIKYRYGEELSVEGLELRVTLGDKTETAHFTRDAVTGYNPTDVTSKEQTLTVSYSGITATYSVSVRDYVVGIETVSAPQSTYLYNEEFATSSGTYRVTYASGKTAENSFYSGYVQGYKKQSIGKQYLSYSYTDSEWEETFYIYDIEVVVLDYVRGISYKPVKAVYAYLEELDSTERVELTMISGTVRYAYLSETEVHDVDSPVADKTNALYALYSERTGTHRLEVKYTDAANDKEHTATAAVVVRISGECILGGAETLADGSSVYYYEVGDKLYIDVRIAQQGVNVVGIDDDSSKDIYYALYTADGSAFDNTQAGKQSASIKIYVNEQTISSGGVSINTQTLRAIVVDTYGLAKATAVRIADGCRVNYDYGQEINGDSRQDVMLELTLASGDKVNVEPMEISYDMRIIGTQTARFRYLNTWLELDIVINDVVSDIAADDVSVAYGNVPEISVYAVYKGAGKVALKASEYKLSEYDLKKVGKQTVTVTLAADATYTTSFTLTVMDGFDKIEVKTAPKTSYAKGEDFDPTSEYIVTTNSGITYTVSYNSTEFEYTPAFDSSAVGRGQKISIYYKGAGGRVLAWSDECVVPNYVVSLTVVQSATKREYGYGETFVTKVNVKYGDGTEKTPLLESDYTTDFNSHKLGTRTVTITYVYNGIAYTVSVDNVRVSDVVNGVKIKSKPTLTEYNYGQTLSLSGAVVVVTYGSEGNVTYSGNEIKENLDVTYSTLQKGYSKVIISVGGMSDSFLIKVNDSSAAISATSVANISVDVKKFSVTIKVLPVTVGEVTACVKSAQYLTAYIVTADADVEASSAEDKNISTGAKLIFRNADGVEVFVFNVYAKGDADGNGVIDSDDAEAIAEAMTAGKSVSEVADYDGDGRVNLTDLVNWARKTGGGEPKNAPVRELAELWISDVKPRKTKEDSRDAQE